MLLIYLIGFFVTMFVTIYILYLLAPDEKCPPDQEIDDGSGYNIIGVMSIVTIASLIWPITLFSFLSAAVIYAVADHFKS